MVTYINFIFRSIFGNAISQITKLSTIIHNIKYAIETLKDNDLAFKDNISQELYESILNKCPSEFIIQEETIKQAYTLMQYSWRQILLISDYALNDEIKNFFL